MELLDRLQTQLNDLEARSLIRKRRLVETPCGPRLKVDGRDMLCFSSNDYLSLAGHPRISEALREGVSLYGAGSGASHLISGHSRAHAQLEERLADFVSPYLMSPRALYFCTGYMANLAVLNGLAAGDKHTEIFSESLNHASLIDGARLSRVAVNVYGHADVAALATVLAKSSASNKIVVTDSVFSMDGDLAPLPELLSLCEQHGAWLVVDDAHGFGTLGENGRGALAHALLTSVDIIAGDEGRERRAHLQALIAQMETGLQLQRWHPLPSQTAIQPIVIGDNAETMRAAAALYAQGLWVGGIRPPTVPAGTARLRVALAAGHTSAEVEQLIAALNALERTSNEL